MPRPVVIALAVAAGLLLLAGAATALDLLTRRTETATRVLPSGRVEVRVGGADVRIVGADRRDVRVTARARHGLLSDPVPAIRARGRVIGVAAECSGPDLFGAGCAVDVRVEVPRDSAVRVDSASGDVDASGLRAGARLSSRSGDVSVDGSDGALQLGSRSGDVSADAVRATTIVAEADSGGVSVAAATLPRRLRASSSSGDVDVELPDEPVRVQAESGSGDRSVDVREDPGAASLVVAHSGSGDVSVQPRS